jgi:hypothetical protein
MSDSENSMAGDAQQRSSKKALGASKNTTTSSAQSKSTGLACGLCREQGALTHRLYASDFHRECCLAVRANIRLMPPAAKAKDKKLFKDDHDAWMVLLGVHFMGDGWRWSVKCESQLCISRVR